MKSALQQNNEYLERLGILLLNLSTEERIEYDEFQSLSQSLQSNDLEGEYWLLRGILGLIIIVQYRELVK